MKTTMKGAALFLALSAIPFAASAQDWQNHGRDRGQQQQPGNGNNGGQQHGRVDRSNGNSASNGNPGWGNRAHGNPGNGNPGWTNRDNGNNDRRWGDRGGWQRGGYGSRPQMPPPQQVNNYYGRGGNYGYRDHDRDRDYRYAPPPRTYSPSRGRGYYSIGYGYRPQPVWTVGNVYYGDDYAPTYSVDDYGDYGLYDPPRGYGWRRDDFGHYLLVAITSGIIADLLFGH